MIVHWYQGSGIICETESATLPLKGDRVLLNLPGVAPREFTVIGILHLIAPWGVGVVKSHQANVALAEEKS